MIFKEQLHYLIRLCAVAICLWGATTHAERYHLPDISDPSYTALSLSEEKKLGKIILAELRSQLPLIDDIEIQSYLRHLGKSILAHSQNRNRDFHFLLVKSPAVNAFATPGGVLAFNAGLIYLTASESELGGVMAHEIAHVTHRHMARMEALSKSTDWLSALSIIGAIIASAYHSDLAELSLFGAAALPIERRLSYTRHFEYEADRFGMKLMADAGLDPSAMPAFFQKLQALEGRHQQIEFLRTHPLTISRLSDAQARAAQYRKPLAKDSKTFHYAKARLHAIQRTTTPPQLTDATIKIYYEALNLIEKRLPARALQHLEKIPSEHRSIPIQLAFAHAYRAMGNWKQAIALLNTLNDLHPGRAAILYYLALCLLADKQEQKALEQISAAAAMHAYYPQFYQLGAQAAIARGRRGEYHEYLADYYAADGRITAALRQLDLAISSGFAHQSLRARITAKRKALEELQKNN